MKRDSTFGLTTFRQCEMMNRPRYHQLLQFTVLPKLRAWKGGNLDNLWWQQDGAPCLVTSLNMRYLDNQSQNRVLSRKPIHGLDWLARSLDLNPRNFCLWGYLKQLNN